MEENVQSLDEYAHTSPNLKEKKPENASPDTLHLSGSEHMNFNNPSLSSLITPRASIAD